MAAARARKPKATAEAKVPALPPVAPVQPLDAPSVEVRAWIASLGALDARQRPIAATAVRLADLLAESDSRSAAGVAKQLAELLGQLSPVVDDDDDWTRPSA